MDHACCASFERVTVNGESARVVQLIKAGGGETVSVACALTAGTRVLVAQMIVLPGVNDETSPLALTVATLVFVLVHVTAVFAPASASNVSVNCCVPPSEMLGASGAMVMLRTVGAATVTVVVPEIVGFATLVARTTAVPAATALTRPVALTVATDGVAELHVTVVAVPASASTVAASCRVCPIAIAGDVGETVTLRING